MCSKLKKHSVVSLFIWSWLLLVHKLNVHDIQIGMDLGSRMSHIHSLSSEILTFLLGKAVVTSSVRMFMPLCLKEVTANPQQAATSLPKLNNLILSIKAMWQICYIFTWTLLKSEAPITGPERKRLFHRHSHTQLTVWLCVRVMRVCPGVIMCNSGKHVDGCVYRAFNHVYEGPFVHMCVCLTLSGCSLCSQFILMWIECANNSSAVRHHFISIIRYQPHWSTTAST